MIEGGNTSTIVALRQKALWAQGDDARARQRNTHLVADLERSLETLRKQKERKAPAELERRQQQLRSAQFEEASRLRKELSEVHERRQRARAEFEREMKAREETAQCQQALQQQLELEKFDAAARSAVRVGVDEQARAAETTIDGGMDHVVQEVAAQTQAAIQAQVRRQVDWIANELPVMLQQQAERALEKLHRPKDGPDASARQASGQGAHVDGANDATAKGAAG